MGPTWNWPSSLCCCCCLLSSPTQASTLEPVFFLDKHIKDWTASQALVLTGKLSDRCFVMAALLRGGHARQGRRGGDRGGRARGGAEHGQVVTPEGFQWTFWKQGNANRSKKKNKELDQEMQIYFDLENNPKIDQNELHTYGVSAGLLEQDGDVVRMLHELVEIYNRMATTRRRYLSKRLHGAFGKEVSLMAKKIQLDSELALSLVDDIRTANGYCPPTPSVFAALPRLY